MRDHIDFLHANDTADPGLNPRLQRFMARYREYRRTMNRPLTLLDVGCWKNPAIFREKASEDWYCGCDFFDSPDLEIDEYISIDLNRESLSQKLASRTFDVVFCGEVIEHLYSPDALMEELKQAMHGQSILIVSTPNLAYYVNRLLLLLSVSPLFVENSAEVKLGRSLKWLGQGRKTEGHIRLFTYRALRDFLNRQQLEIAEARHHVRRCEVPPAPPSLMRT